MKLRALIVDDEPLGRERMRMHLAADDRIDIIGECQDGKEAVAAIEQLAPDVVFLDVQMPELNGFDVVQALGSSATPQIVFVTAYDEYAIKAFDVNAVDYILKPVDPARLQTAVSRVIAERESHDRSAIEGRLRNLIESVNANRKYAARVVIRDKGGAFFLPVGEIEWIEAEGNYVRIHSRTKSHLLRQTLRELEAQLDPEHFVRVHRSGIVNIDFVARVEPWVRGEYRIILRDGTALTSSRSYGNAFRALME
jgi:two-component system, LytTR family, response regulator